MGYFYVINNPFHFVMLRFVFISMFSVFCCFSVHSQSDCPNPFDGDGDATVTNMDLLGCLAVLGDSDLDGDGVWDITGECLSELTAEGNCVVDGCVPYDDNGDMAVTVADFLGLLLVFGDFDSDGDGIWGSQDECEDAEACNYAENPTESCNYEGVDVNENGLCDDDEVTGCTYAFSCNYNEDATFDDGSCADDVDGDDICDDVDDCVGVLDACSVCNGPGEIYECGCADIPEGDCDCDGNSSTPWASVAVTARQTLMPMASVTTSTTVSERMTSAASATDLAPSTIVDVPTSLKGLRLRRQPARRLGRLWR